MTTKVFCEGYNHVAELSDKELEEKGINSLDELYTPWHGYLCPRHLAAEFFKCETCLNQGYTRYDSLVLCKEHNEAFKPVVQKLNSIFENNPNVTIIRDLGL